MVPPIYQGQTDTPQLDESYRAALAAEPENR
jgi:hypothetical protein